MKRLYKFGLLILPLVALAIAYCAFNNRNADEYVTLKRGSIIESVYGIGTVKSDRDYVLKIGVSSVVEEGWVHEGDSVKTGSKLIKLQDFPVFKAPFEGVISSFNYHLGETVFAGATILTLIDMKNRYLQVSLEQTGALKVKPGLKVRINFEGLRGKTFSGKVVSVYSNQDRLLLRIQPEELPTNILPGMSADIAVVIGEKRDALLIPVSAISLGNVTLKSGKSVRIQLGIVDGAMAEIISDNLREGDEVILDASSSD